MLASIVDCVRFIATTPADHPRKPASQTSSSLKIVAAAAVATLLSVQALPALAQAALSPAPQQPATSQADPQTATPSAPQAGQPSAAQAPQPPVTQPAAAQAPASQAAPMAPAPAQADAEDDEEGEGTLPQAAPAAAMLPHDLSPWGMFMQADIVVKAVMIGLALASLVTWTIWLAKSVELISARARTRAALQQLERAGSLTEAARTIADGKAKLGPVPSLIDVALDEAGRSDDLSAEGVKERAAISLTRVQAEAGRNMTRGTGILATIGSTAPFIGLFGTVWGIMNSFIGISVAKTTNLAVVAPGIAEALLATAIGLVAAIPAVIIYNIFARSITGYRALLSDAAGEVMRHLSRDLERRDLAAAAHRLDISSHSTLVLARAAE